MFILKGLSLSAQIDINLSSVLVDSSCQQLYYRLTATATGGTQPYTFELDSLFSNKTGVFENVFGGIHSVYVRDAAGQYAQKYIRMESRPSKLTARFYGGLASCDSNLTQANFYLEVLGGEPPYRYFIGNDTIGTTVDSFRLLTNTRYYVRIKDASNCTFSSILQTPNAFISYGLFANAVFTPNRCGDSIGTAKIDLYPFNLTLESPLNMSFNEQPFSSNTVFTNIKANNTYSIKAKTINGCTVEGNIYVPSVPPINDIEYSYFLKNCATQTGQLYIRPLGGQGAYSFFLNGQLKGSNDSLIFINDVPIGTHTVKILSKEGCEFTKTIVLTGKNILNPLNVYYQGECGQMGTLSIRTDNTGNIQYQVGNLQAKRDSTDMLSWKISSGNYPIRLIDSNGCVLKDTLKLYAVGNFNASWSLSTGDLCNDSVFTCLITPSGGVAPYNYIYDSFDNVPTTNNRITLKKGEYKGVIINDANNCRIYVEVYLPQDTSVYIVPRFRANCNNELGTLSISVVDSNVMRPLSISFNGQPFSSDTVFQNVSKDSSYVIIVKSKLGCSLTTRIYTKNIIQDAPLSGIFTHDTCSNQLGRGSLITSVSGGLPPYQYTWSTGEKTASLIDVPIGSYFLTVTDAANCKIVTNGTIASCVWPGDTDTSGLVDNRDLLNIGLAFGETGIQRCAFDSMPNHPFCTLWIAHKAKDWSKQTSTHTNYKHIDANGDGIINAADTIAIYRNWNRVHQATFPNNEFLSQSAVTPIYVKTSNVQEGSWVSFPVILGERDLQAENVYGLAFSIKYPSSIIEPNTMRLETKQSWLGKSASLLSVFKEDSDNTFHVGIVKTDKLNTSGEGQIATLTFKLKAGVSGTDLQFAIFNHYLINNVNENIPIVGRSTTVNVLTNALEPTWANQIHIYPNPTIEEVFVESKDIEIQNITLIDLAGKVIKKVDKNIPLSIPFVGTYFLKIETDKGWVMRKVVKL